MGSVNVFYLLSEAGQKKSLLAGGDGKREQRLTVPATPELLERAEISADGTATWTLTRSGLRSRVHGYKVKNNRCTDGSFFDAPRIEEVYSAVLWDEPQTAEQLLAWDIECQRSQAHKRAQAESDLAQLLAEYRTWKAARDEQDRRREEERKAEIAARTAREEAAEARKTALREQRLREAEEWTREYGSSRLRKALELGLLADSLGVYLDERLERERPGWSWDDTTTDLEDIRNPTEEALLALEEARKIDAGTDLGYLPHRHDEDECDCYDCDRPGEVMLAGKFLGRWIRKAV